MTLARELMKRMMERFGGIIDLKERPEVLEEIVEEVIARMRGGGGGGAAGAGSGAPAEALPPTAAPFGVSWMDSWVAHWVYAENLKRAERQSRELATVMQGLVDLKLRERLDEIRRFLADNWIHAASPEAGPPEMGVPPAGPARFAPGGGRFDGPDGGAPPPAPEPPADGPREPGVPPPAGPPAGPDAGAFAENPWILYWFVSLKLPALLDVIDLHIMRRLEAMRRR
jgi:hypothetical protein